MRQRRPLGGHEVGGLHRAQRHRVLVSAAVAHHADRAHRQEDGECLRGLVVPARGTELVDEDRVGTLQKVDVLALHLAEDAHAKSRAGERMAEDHLARQAEREAEATHLVLEELAQRFQ